MAERIGDFLVRIGAMSQAQVEEVVLAQERDEELRMFGEIAIEKGFIDDSALRKYIDHKTGEGASSASPPTGGRV
jgi:hypothetical protein